MLELLQQAMAWLGTGGIAAIGTASSGLLAYKVAMRQERRAQRTMSRQLEDLVLKSSSEQLEAVMRQLGRYDQELQVLREARFVLEDALTVLRDTVIAHRTMLHEYERRLGLPETAFPPLPRPGLPKSA